MIMQCSILSSRFLFYYITGASMNSSDAVKYYIFSPVIEFKPNFLFYITIITFAAC